MNDDIQTLVSLAKRRGFIFPGSDIYGGLAGTYDYGPLGSRLKENLKRLWIKKFVDDRRDMHLVDAAILMNPGVWQASGHVDGFVDPLVEDLETKKRYRADHLIEEAGLDPLGLSPEDMTKLIREHDLKSPDGNALSDVKTFNMMFATQIGAVADSANTTYLRPETAQGMFVNFKNVVDTMRPKLPFGMAQIGKAFRNEITPRDFIFRVREFEQMEIEYFVREGEWEENFTYWKDEMLEWMEWIGLDMNRVHEVEVGEEDRAHYSKRTIDFEFTYPFGQKELYGLAYRTNYDLSKHAEKSGQRLQIEDEQSGGLVTPHVIEPSMGLDRTILALLVSAYRAEILEDGSERVYLALPPHVAPYKVAVSPLVKNKPDIVDGAQEVFNLVKTAFGAVVWDDHGNIGKRYRRQDEIGTPFCVVFDYDSLEDGSVTVRHRDSMTQERVLIAELERYLAEKLGA